MPVGQAAAASAVTALVSTSFRQIGVSIRHCATVCHDGHRLPRWPRSELIDTYQVAGSPVQEDAGPSSQWPQDTGEDLESEPDKAAKKPADAPTLELLLPAKVSLPFAAMLTFQRPIGKLELSSQVLEQP